MSAPSSVRGSVVRGACVLLASLLLAVLAGATAGPAHAAPGDVVPSYDVAVVVREDGSLQVREEIEYSFGSSDRHGIFRNLQRKYEIEDDAEHYRVLDISGVRVASPTGAPADVEVGEEGLDTVLRIGDPDRTVSGTHTYVVEYEVRGALNEFDLTELAWDVTGHDWDARIEAVRATVTGPTAPAQLACYAGSAGSSLPCDSSSLGSRTATFSQGPLDRGEGLTVVVGWPPGQIDVPPPLLEQRWSFGRAFSIDPLPLATALLTLLLGVAAVGWTVWSRGRDRRYVGMVPGLTPMPGDDPTAVERKPLFGRRPVVVDFAPPPDMRPGEAGTLLDQSADVLDVTATIVDLAVRGYLRIEEVPDERRFFKKHDWRLVKLADADDTFRRYERTLFEALFDGRHEVTLGELKQTFADELGHVRKQLYSGVVEHKWFRRRPDQVRATWTGIGLLAAVLGVALTFGLARWTSFGLTGVAATVVGLVLLVSGRFMPARTARGSAALAQLLGFRQYIRTAEAEQIRFEEREAVFNRYLPFAIVFGETERWADTFASLGSAAGGDGAGGALASPGVHGLYWYAALGGFDPSRFGDSLADFTTTTAGSISAAAPTSSSGSGFGGGGFAGGGFGGGGGGSW